MKRGTLVERDTQDPVLRRNRFALPESSVYLDGNSLGPPLAGTGERVAETIDAWRDRLVGGWNEAGWIEVPERIAARVARLVGGEPNEIAVTDSTSVNLFQMLVAATRLRPDRTEILVEADGFPTDRYISEGIAELLGFMVRKAPRDGLAAAITEETAVVTAAHVDYRTGHRLDAPEVCATAQDVGALTVLDLAHSTGALDVDLRRWGADFAVGCSYKFLNGGPGAPGYLWVNGDLQPPATIRGWWGHDRPFTFADRWAPADGARRFRNGTPPIVALVPVLAALEAFDGLTGGQLQTRAEELTALFIYLVDEHVGLEIVTPRESSHRGAQVCLRHPEAFSIIRALIAHDVVGDHRPPDILRFGFAPLHTRWTDVWDAAMALLDVLETEAWQEPEFQRRTAVP